MSKQPVKEIFRQVKPLMSTNKEEARRRVIELYRKFYREIPPIVFYFKLDVSVSEAKAKLREEFLKNKNITDIRAIDLLVLKGHMHYNETLKSHKQMCHVMYLFKDTALPKPKEFLEKFLSGSD